MSFILLVACTFLVYLAEKSDDQPGKEPESGELGNLGDGLYWGIVSKLNIFFTKYIFASLRANILGKMIENLR